MTEQLKHPVRRCKSVNEIMGLGTLIFSSIEKIKRVAIKLHHYIKIYIKSIFINATYLW